MEKHARLLRTEVVGLFDKKTGLFRPWGKDTYSNFPAYLNPMSVLALLPLLEDCVQPDGKKFASDLGHAGILDAEILPKKKQQAEKLPGSLANLRKAQELTRMLRATGEDALRRIKKMLNPPRPSPPGERNHGWTTL